MLLEAHNISVNLGKRNVFSNVDFRVTPQSRIGLIGVNGAGKSTLFKTLMGEIEAFEGNVVRAANIRVRCLTQNPEITPGNTLHEELLSVFEEVEQYKKEEEELCNKLMTVADDEEMQVVLARLAFVQDEQERLDAGRVEEKIGRMVTGLGFKLEELNRKVDDFSGGWQMRINLAKILLQEADVILMDEPTNHLDIEAVEWLEEFLRNYSKGIVLISHDRQFLNEVVNEIAEMERGTLTSYKGNYTQYVEQKAMARDQQVAAAKRQAKSIAKQEEFINRFKASANRGTQAKSKAKQLAKIERIDAPKTDLKALTFDFPDPKPSGSDILKIDNLAKGFEDNLLYSNVSLDLDWTKEEPQRVFILGANGCGKTTLFKMFMGLEESSEGTITFGDRVELGYYAQHQLQILDPNKTVLESLEEVMPAGTHPSDIRGILGRFLFSSEQVEKEVRVISGGEKGRLALAKLMVTGPNVLLLDEPTNHLDTGSQDAVEAALKSFKGTSICISHDRYLINSLATQIWEFYEGRMIVFKGSYELYLEKRDGLIKKLRKEIGLDDEVEVVEQAPAPNAIYNQERRENNKKERRTQSLEKKIVELNNKKEELTEELSNPKYSDDYKKLESISLSIEEIDQEIAEKEANWAQLSEELERA